MRFKTFYLQEVIKKPSTKEFKDWVGYSKIPIQYHYSEHNFDRIDVTKSDLGFHVGTLEQAEYRKKTLGGSGKIMSFFINLRNPLRLKDEGSFHAESITTQLLKKGIIDKQLEKEIKQGGWKEHKKFDSIVRDKILEKGYDGIVYNNETEGKGNSYIIIDPKTIKSAENNSGKYSRESDKINESYEQLNEASKELNLISFLSDKISKTLDEITRNPEQFKKYKPNNSGQFVIPFKKFIGGLDVPRNSFIKFISYGKLFLDYGSTKDSTYPYLEVISHKDGRNIRKKAGGYYDNEFNPDIHLPFINQQTDLPFQGYSKHWKSLLTHELTHANQDFNRKITTGTSQLSTEEWFSNKIEQEAILHQIYKPIQKYIKSLFSEMEYKRTADGKYKDIKGAINISNSLFKWFESFESFKRSLRMSLNVIFLDYESAKNRYLYLWDNHKDVYNKFLEDSYSELKKEFKNVIPTKELKYEKESK